MTLPREDTFTRETPPPERPARGIPEEKLVEDAQPGDHASLHRKNGSDPLTPVGIGAAKEDHAHTLTREVLLLPTIDAHNGPIGVFPVTLTGTTDTAHFVWRVPADWIATNAIEVVMIPDTEETIQMDIDVAVSAEGEQYDADERQSLNEQLAIAAGDVDDIVEWDILSIGPMFAGIVAGDYVAVRLTDDSNGLLIIGLRVNYQASGGAAGGGGGGGDHNAVTIDSVSGADGFLGLTDQDLELLTQVANVVAAGPVAGGADYPTFRALVEADIPAHDYDLHSGGVPFAELEYDDGTSDPLQDGEAAADGNEDSAARKDHIHPKHHAQSHSDADHTDSGEHILRDGSVPFTDTVGGVTPAAGADLATKDYVDLSVNFISEYYFNDDASDIGGYFDMTDTPTGEGESDFETAGLGQGDDQLLDVWATPVGVPGVTVLEAGVYSGHIHIQRTGGNRNYFVYFKLFTRTHPAGAETERFTSELSEEITDDNKTGLNLHGTLSSEVVIASTDRIIIKWYANLGVGANTDLTIYAEGDNNTRASLPISTEVLNQVYLRQDGTKPLSADWAVGAHKITGLTPGAASGEVVEYDQLRTPFGERAFQAVPFNFTADNETGDGKFYFHIDSRIDGMDLVDVHAEVITAGVSGNGAETEDIQIHNVTQAADMLSTKLTIDAGETGSDTAAAPAVIDGANDDVAENDLLRVDVDAVHTTPAKGLLLTLGFRLP